MPIEIYDDEYTEGPLCMDRHPARHVQCRRPENHKDKHQRKAAGVQWFYGADGGSKSIYFTPSGEEIDRQD